MRVFRLVIALALAGFCSTAAARSPNVIIFYADDMGIGDAGCYGCRDIKTPNIDSLARSGVRFTNYYSAAPVCSPSRAALLTGRVPARAGVPSNVGSHPGDPGLPGSEVTFAELAKARGYATALIGKWHQGFSKDNQPNDQGFDYFFGHHAGCIDYYSHMFHWDPPPHHDLYRNREEIHAEGQYITDMIAREASNFVKQHRSEPFLMYVAFNAPHYPLQPPVRLCDAYKDLKEPRRSYAGVLTALDEGVGEVMEQVRELGLERDTLVVFASDNGATAELRAGGAGNGNNGPYRGYKFSLFEGGIHLPGLVSWPGTVPAGQTRDQLVMGTDICPTVADAIGAELPNDRKLDGISWLPLLRNPKATGHDVLYWRSSGQDAVRRGKWKLLRNPITDDQGGPRRGRSDEVILVDLDTDPGETKNLSSQHPEMVDELLKLHAAWWAEIVRARPEMKAR